MKDFNLSKKTQKQAPPTLEKEKVKISLGLLIKGIITLTSLTVVIYCFIAVPAYFSQPIDFTKIDTIGNEILTRETLLDQMKLKDPTLWNKIDPFELSIKLIEHPWVDEASVHRKVNLG